MMRRKLSTITREFAKIKQFSERLSCSLFSAIVAAFEAYGTALCGHIPIACPTEQSPRQTQTQQDAGTFCEPRTQIFAVARNRPNLGLPAVHGLPGHGLGSVH